MTGKSADRNVQLVRSVERVFPVDPTGVWALVADPSRVGEWAAVETVGYLGTELPQVGHIVFVRTRRWQAPSRARRVAIDRWEAGSGYRCTVQQGRFVESIQFEISVTPEVTGDGVATRVRITQRMEVPAISVRLLSHYVTRRSERILDRLGEAVAE